MTIRTITQLPKAESNEFVSSWMEMSTPSTANVDRFTSKKANYGDILNDIKTSTISKIVDSYHLNTPGGTYINVYSLSNNVNALYNNNLTFKGKKKFNEWPYVTIDFPSSDKASDPAYSVYGNNFEYIIPNMKTVRQLVDENIVFMSTTNSVVSEGNPLPLHGNPNDNNAGVVEYLDYSNTIGLGKFYYWHIDA